MFALLLLFASAADARLVGQAPTATVHGVVGRDASLGLMKRSSAFGRFRCELMKEKTPMKALLCACYALRKEETFSILQLRKNGSSMYVCAPVNSASGGKAHQLVAILSSTNETPLGAVKEALKWHAATYPEISGCL